jgi:hypothetical protein
VKGGAPETFAALHNLSALEDVWQLHRSRNEGARNFSDDRIANLDETTAHWIKVRARDDGSFVVTNGRTGASNSYAPGRTGGNGRMGRNSPARPALPAYPAR